MSKTGYFPGLHGLRFIAATLVIIHHLEQYKAWQGLPNRWGIAVIDHLGHMPVGFFFVLSGFLITHILLKEVQFKSSLNIRLFYWKRVLRLWPVYFLVVILALVAIPRIAVGFDPDLLRFEPYAGLFLLLFLPNLLRIIQPQLVGGNQLWSVGVEEQFYLIWPFAIQLFHKNIYQFLIGFILFKLGVQEFIGLGAVYSKTMNSLYYLLQLFPVEQMAIGGIGAAMLIKSSSLLQIVRSDLTFFIAVAFLLLLFFLDIDWVLKSHLEGIVFLCLIMNIIHRRSLYHFLEKPGLIKMGNISYGIYMYHTIAITCTLSVLQGMDVSSLSYDLALYAGSLFFTFVLASLSYRFIETPIMSLRNAKRPKHWTAVKPLSVN